MSISNYVDRPIAVARAVAGGAAGGCYLEAYLILTSLISGLAAYAWPRKEKDKKQNDKQRYVELLVRYAPAARRISLPVLLAARRQLIAKLGCKVDLQELTRALQGLRPEMLDAPHADRILRGTEVDCTESQVLEVCSMLARSTVRKYSYACLLYEHLRCAVVHEYALSGEATATRMWSDDPGDADVSYVNFLDGADASRKIFFPLELLTMWLRKAASGLDADLQAHGVKQTARLAAPESWWLDGRADS